MNTRPNDRTSVGTGRLAACFRALIHPVANVLVRASATTLTALGCGFLRLARVVVGAEFSPRRSGRRDAPLCKQTPWGRTPLPEDAIRLFEDIPAGRYHFSLALQAKNLDELKAGLAQTTALIEQIDQGDAASESDADIFIIAASTTLH